MTSIAPSLSPLMTIVGNRPQFIKMAPVNKAICAAGIHHLVIHTGQHHDHALSGVFFEELGLARPDYQLEVSSSLHGAMTADMLQRIEAIMLEARPAGAIIYGDTNSSLAAALAAAKLLIPIAHVESGPRMYDMAQPEEVNRVIVDKLAALRFCADRQSVENLKREGLTEGVYFTGDPMLDVFCDYRNQPTSSMALPEEPFVLATLHRPKNVDSKEALQTLLELLGALPFRVLLPLHPRTKKRIKDHGLEGAFAALSNLTLCEPLGYREMMHALIHCAFVVTDSGGVQREAYFAGKYCFSLLDVSPWPEIAAAGWQRCTGFAANLDIAAIAHEARHLTIPAEAPPLFGNGTSAQQMVAIIQKTWFD